MDIKEVKVWRMNPLTCVMGIAADNIDWLIAEVERLAAELSTRCKPVIADHCSMAELTAERLVMIGQIAELDAERDQLLQTVVRANKALNAATLRAERLEKALEIYRELLEECKSFCCRTDGDGDALHIELARRIHAALAAEKGK